MDDQYLIKSEAQLTEILGEPSDLVQQKICHELDDVMNTFIARSPLIFLSTIDTNGLSDVSPKGDAAGFVQVNAQGELLIPERPGNKLIYGFKNILANKSVGLIFVVPGTRETLRIKGTATLSHEPALLESLAAQGKPALLCTIVRVSECFFHCGKAMIRSNAWKPEKWGAYSDSLISVQVAQKMGGDDAVAQYVETQLEQSYKDSLY